MATQTETIDIKIREDGARVVQRNIENVGKTAEKSASSVDFLKRALIAIGGAAAANEILQLADAYTNLQNRLRASGLEGSNLKGVYDALRIASNDTRSSLEGSVELYSRLAISSKELGVSQRQLIDFTKSLNQAILLSGASATEAQAGLIQLSQGMASGTLRGDELRSVLEQLPAVADVIAKKLGVTRGELRQLGEDGKITAQTILQAFQASRVELEERFGKTVPTLSQSFQVLKNNFLDFVGRVDQSLGITTAFSKAALLLANNIDVVVKALFALSSGLLLIGGSAFIVQRLVGAFTALSAVIAANPIGAFVVLLTTAITAVLLFRDNILLGTDSVTTLGDFIRALGERISAFVSSVSQVAQGFLGPLGDALRAWFGDAEFSVIGILRLVAKAADTYVGLWRGAIFAVAKLFQALPGAIQDLFIQGLNVILNKLGEFVNKAGQLLNGVAEFAGLGKIVNDQIDLSLQNTHAGEAKNLGKGISDAFKEGFDIPNSATAFIDSIESRAKELGAARAEADRLAKRVPNDPSSLAGAATKLVDAKEVKETTNALRGLLDKIAPVQGALLELAKATEVLNKAEALGVINSKEKARYLELLNQQYKDMLDPVGKINRGLDEQTQLLSVNAREREVMAQTMQMTEDLKRQGFTSEEAASEVAAIRERLVALQNLNSVVAEQDRLLAGSVEQRRQFTDQLTAMQTLLANPSSGFTQQDANSALNASNPELFAGTQVALDAQVASYNRMYAQIDEMRQKDLISEQTAQQLKSKVSAQQTATNLETMQGFFGNLATLSRSGNKKLALIGKAAAISQATIDGILGVQKALSSAPPPLNFALAAAVGAAAAVNVASIASAPAGFQDGGFTGMLGQSQVAGVVHGQEFVVNAEATRRNRSALEAMNKGASMAQGSSSPVVKVIINNNAEGTKARQEERQGPEGRELEITIERVAARSVTSGGSLATAMENQYGLNRAQGSTY